MDNLILIGFMGAGKTTVGKLLAREKGLQFVDTDDRIVAEQKQSIPDIFSKYGESFFSRSGNGSSPENEGGYQALRDLRGRRDAGPGREPEAFARSGMRDLSYRGKRDDSGKSKK